MFIVDKSSPITNEVELDYSAEEVKAAIVSLLRKYPRYFITNKSSINNELGTYVFMRPKGVDNPTIRLTVKVISANKTCLDITCSTDSLFYTQQNMQTAISEVQSILLEKLRGVSDETLLFIIKNNNSGNGVGGCLKTILLIIFVLFALITILGGLLSMLL